MKKLIEQLEQLRKEVKGKSIKLEALYNKYLKICKLLEHKLECMYSNCLITDLEYDVLWKHFTKGYTISELAKDNKTTVEKMKYVYRKGLRKITL